MANPSEKSRRKKNFVDRSVQGSIVLRMVAYWALYLFSTGAFLYFIELLGGIDSNAFKNMVLRHAPTAFATVILAPIFLWDLCKLTNRFAGPMVRLRRGMQDLAEGREVQKIKFRKGDYWQDLAEDFNRVIERVEASEAAGKEPVAELELTKELGKYREPVCTP